jgi:hypothetical protein
MMKTNKDRDAIALHNVTLNFDKNFLLTRPETQAVERLKSAAADNLELSTSKSRPSAAFELLDSREALPYISISDMI